MITTLALLSTASGSSATASDVGATHFVLVAVLVTLGVAGAIYSEHRMGRWTKPARQPVHVSHPRGRRPIGPTLDLSGPSRPGELPLTREHIRSS